MKITKVDAIQIEDKPADQPGWRPIVCRVYTDTGLYGDGEAAIAYGVGSTAAYGMIQDLAKLIIGMNPLDTEVIWEKLYKSTFWAQNGGPIVFAGISALDIALWDIKGKYFNVPVYQLLGGKMRDKLRCYASQLQFGWGERKTPAYQIEDYVANAKKAVSEGYDAIKIDFFTFDPKGYRYSSEETTRVLDPYHVHVVIDRLSSVVEKQKDNSILITNIRGKEDRALLIRLCKEFTYDCDGKILIGNGVKAEQNLSENKRLQQEVFELARNRAPGKHLYLIEQYYHELAISYISRKVGENGFKLKELEQIRCEDEETGRNLYETLYWYLRMKRNVSQTAAKLKIHRNTLLPRLTRLNDMLDLDNRDGAECEKLLVAMEIERMKNSDEQ